MTSFNPSDYDRETCHVTIWQSNRGHPIELAIAIGTWRQLLQQVRARHKERDQSLFPLPPVVQQGDVSVTWCMPACITSIEVRAPGGPEAGERLGFVTEV